jgi:hypothetical protein
MIAVLVLAALAGQDLVFEPWFAEDGVTVSIARASGPEAPWIRGTAELDAGAAAVASIVADYASYAVLFAPDVAKARLLESGPEAARVHVVWRYPFPLRNRDAVLLYRDAPSADGRTRRVSWTSAPARDGDPREGVRIARVRGSTEIEALAEDRCRVTYTYLGDLGGRFPRAAEQAAWRREPVAYIQALRRALGRPGVERAR